eukprot:TRINITY_DN7429_c0_g1_i1.p1 TRINITY_DN7429_c0_g1~~TRINITY_DN7429_c0_g1_i1.p1  ORF type:complete len:225 (+),score=10.18 TRINITY_DN7429_c0_g1_i1:2-676(+)
MVSPPDLSARHHADVPSTGYGQKLQPRGQRSRSFNGASATTRGLMERAPRALGSPATTAHASRDTTIRLSHRAASFTPSPGGPITPIRAPPHAQPTGAPPIQRIPMADSHSPVFQLLPTNPETTRTPSTPTRCNPPLPKRDVRHASEGLPKPDASAVGEPREGSPSPSSSLHMDRSPSPKAPVAALFSSPAAPERPPPPRSPARLPPCPPQQPHGPAGRRPSSL